MKLYFTTEGFYNNPNVPLYDKGKVYDIEDIVPGYIQRWLMRGAIEVVKGTEHDKLAVSQPNPQGGFDKKRATPVGGTGNPVELSPHVEVKAGTPEEKPKEEPKKADNKSANKK